MAETNPYGHPYPHHRCRNVKLTPVHIRTATPKPERFNQTTNPYGHPYPHHRVMGWEAWYAAFTPRAKPCRETLSLFAYGRIVRHLERVQWRWVPSWEKESAP